MNFAMRRNTFAAQDKDVNYLSKLPRGEAGLLCSFPPPCEPPPGSSEGLAPGRWFNGQKEISTQIYTERKINTFERECNTAESVLVNFQRHLNK